MFFQNRWMALGLVGDHGVRVHMHVVQAPAVDLGPVLIQLLMEAGTTALTQAQTQDPAKSPHVLVCMHPMSWSWSCPGPGKYKVLIYMNWYTLVL